MKTIRKILGWPFGILAYVFLTIGLILIGIEKVIRGGEEDEDDDSVKGII